MDWQWLIGDNWATVFYVSGAPAQMFVRASCFYLGLFLMMRFVLRRHLGSLGTTDLMVIVMIASTANNAMGNQNKSITDALLMAGTMIFWNVLLQYLGQHVPWIARLLHPPAICLVKNGRFNRKAMDQELITEDEILTHMREQGVADVKRVRLACLEGDGKISVLTHDGKRHRKPKAIKG